MQKRFRGVDGVLCGKISFSDSGNKIQISLETEDFSLARSFTLSKR